MLDKDKDGRIIVNSPVEALTALGDQYEQFRKIATLSFSVAKKELALDELAHVLAEAKRAVESCRNDGRGDEASEWRKIEEFVSAMQNELYMWVFLRKSEFHAAWDSLTVAQAAAEHAAQWLPDFEPAQHINEHLESIESTIFPKQMFFSPSFIVEEAQVECTICGLYGGNCDHIPGEIHDGRVAGRVIHEIIGVREISVVRNPANKRARAMTLGATDLLTGEDLAKVDSS